MSSDSSSDDDAYGPALPPHMLQKKKVEEEKGTSAIQQPFIGPGLPPGFNSTSIMTQQEELVDERVDPMPRRPVTAATLSTTTTTTITTATDYYGDDQPAAFTISGNRKVNAVVVGAAANEREDPSLSSSLLPSAHDDEEDDDDDDDDICGPFPPEHPKAKMSFGVDGMVRGGGNKPKSKREEWMLIPPKNKPISNLVSRKFLPRSLETRNDEDDETNEEQDLKEEFEAKLIAQRDELMSNLQSESRKRTTESLLESHRKNLKKRKREESKSGKGDEEKKERRPFDRDNDLKVGGLNADDKKRFMDRTSSELKGRFSHGKRSGKFL